MTADLYYESSGFVDRGSKVYVTRIVGSKMQLKLLSSVLKSRCENHGLFNCANAVGDYLPHKLIQASIKVEEHPGKSNITELHINTIKVTSSV